MWKKIRNRHFLLFDAFLLSLAAYVSFVLRLDRLALGNHFPVVIIFGSLALIILLLVFRSMGIYSRYWQYASVDELLLLIGAVTAGTLLATVSTFLLDFILQAEWNLPRSIPFIYLLLALTVTAGPRMMIRTLALYERRGRAMLPMRRMLIMGAGDAGEMIAREMQKNAHLGMLPVGFVDDDPRKHGMHIHGIPVLGNRSEIPRLAAQQEARQVVIAMPAAPGKTIREIVAICEQARVDTKIMPGIYELLGGQASINQLRDVDIEDLLRREAVQTDTTAVRALLKGKRVLITGGGGSIGGELCRQVLQSQPAEIILLGHGENSLFAMQHELHRLRTDADIKITPIVADVRFAGRIQTIFRAHRPDIVFHAAAHKHVPLMELNPVEAITNNVRGTQNVLHAAIAANVPHFVMISTDKAVNPTSVMGASKRAAELLVHQAAKQTGKPYVTVRFGNVLGSRGSVVLTFKQQIANGGPVTVTHPEMKRFFMTIPEAVQLVLQAATIGHGGEVFVLDMGEPMKIVDLARDLIELSGLEVGRDIDIVFTGMRPGEKLFEELFIPGENYRRTQHEKIFLAANASSFVLPDLDEMVDALVGAAEREDETAVYRGLQNLIPEFEPVQHSVVGNGKRTYPPLNNTDLPSITPNQLPTPSYPASR